MMDSIRADENVMRAIALRLLESVTGRPEINEADVDMVASAEAGVVALRYEGEIFAALTDLDEPEIIMEICGVEWPPSFDDLVSMALV